MGLQSVLFDLSPSSSSTSWRRGKRRKRWRKYRVTLTVILVTVLTGNPGTIQISYVLSFWLNRWRAWRFQHLADGSKSITQVTASSAQGSTEKPFANHVFWFGSENTIIETGWRINGSCLESSLLYFWFYFQYVSRSFIWTKLSFQLQSDLHSHSICKG